MIIKDTLPLGVKYLRSNIKLNDLDITNDNGLGRISYNEKTREYSYTLSSSWLGNPENYKGKTIKIQIEVEVEKYDDIYKNITNTYINNVKYSSNEVSNTAIYKQVEYKYESKTEDKELPKEISTTTGEYKISDNHRYLVGEKITRLDSVPKETIYLEYIDGELIGTWKLINWNTDEEIVNNKDIIFIGYWEFTPEVKVPVTASNPSMLILVIYLVLSSIEVIYILKSKKILIKK